MYKIFPVNKLSSKVQMLNSPTENKKAPTIGFWADKYAIPPSPMQIPASTAYKRVTNFFIQTSL